MKKVLVSSALSALLVLPAAALEIYNDDGKSVDVYGSIRGYVGMGENAHVGGAANFLFGVQTNSHIGFNIAADKFKAKVEFGANEPDSTIATLTPLRFFWGSYDTGVGTILVGKANTPTSNPFSTGVLNNDNALNSFGMIGTSTRRLQVQYNIAGLSLALISDYLADNIALQESNAGSTMPRIAASYTIKGDKAPLFQIAGTYKNFKDGDTGFARADARNAWHISVGTKPTFGNSFVSLYGFYGKNQDYYGEVGTNYNGGTFGHQGVGAFALGNNDATGDVKRGGGAGELGIGLSKDATLTFGFGYQETFGDITGKYKSIGTFVQLPYKVSANFTFTPVIAWYQTTGVKGAMIGNSSSGGTLTAGSLDKVTSVVAAGRVMWNF